jgi:hypothetical protein
MSWHMLSEPCIFATLPTRHFDLIISLRGKYSNRNMNRPLGGTGYGYVASHVVCLELIRPKYRYRGPNGPLTNYL